MVYCIIDELLVTVLPVIHLNFDAPEKTNEKNNLAMAKVINGGGGELIGQGKHYSRIYLLRFKGTWYLLYYSIKSKKLIFPKPTPKKKVKIFRMKNSQLEQVKSSFYNKLFMALSKAKNRIIFWFKHNAG